MIATLRLFVPAAVLAAMLLGAAGCNTMEGFGEDLQALGGAMSDKAGNGKDSDADGAKTSTPDN
jgi:entericidin A